MIYTYTGTDSFRLQQAIQTLQSKFVHEHGDLALERYDGDEVPFDSVIAAVSSLPFLASKKLVIVRNLSKNKQATEEVRVLLDAVLEEVDLLLIESKPDKRTTFYKTLQKNTQFELFDELDKYGSAQWVVEHATGLGVQIDRRTAEFLVDRVGANLQLLDKELQKLSALTDNIEQTHIEEQTLPTLQSSVFDLLEAAASGDSKRALELYEEQRLQKVEPQAVWAMCIWQLHVFALVSTSKSANSQQISQEARISPYVATKALVSVKKLGAPRIRKLVHLLRKYDVRSKREMLDMDEVVRFFLVSVAA